MKYEIKWISPLKRKPETEIVDLTCDDDARGYVEGMFLGGARECTWERLEGHTVDESCETPYYDPPRGWRYLKPGEEILASDRRICGSPVSDMAVGVAVDLWDCDQFVREI